MTKDVLIVDFLRELNKAYDQLNDILFKNQLRGIQLTLNEKNDTPTTLAYYRYNDENIWSGKYNSIVINPLSLNGDHLDILSSLVHEMVHQFNFENQGIIKSRRGGHHKDFKNKCQEVFLEPEFISRRGWAKTNYTTQLVMIFNQLDIDIDCLKLLTYNTELLPKVKLSTETSSYTYFCENCNIDFKMRRARKLICGECEDEFDVVPPTKLKPEDIDGNNSDDSDDDNENDE